MASLKEAYAPRLNIANGIYAKAHDGQAMSENKKLALACVLNNTNKFLTEKLGAQGLIAAPGTNSADIQKAKRFVMNINNVVLPTLVAEDLVMVVPMTSRAGFVTFMEYVAGNDKGGVKVNDVFNSGLYGLGEMTEDRINYTAMPVSETAKADGITDWPALGGKAHRYDGLDSEGKAIWTKIDVADIKAGNEIKYLWNNVDIPQKNIPTISAIQREKPLICVDRKIQIYWSQLAEFDLKQQTGEDLSKTLPEEAISELKWEIDSEIVAFLKGLAGEALPELTFDKKLPVGVGMQDHYAGFLAIIEEARSIIYARTRRYRPNYMVCAHDVLNVLSFCPGFKAANTANVNGPFVAGSLNGLKVVVSPRMESGEFFLGVNESKVSAAVYGAYMPIVPTMLLGRADGSMNQGFSTVYALDKLHEGLVVAGKIIVSSNGSATAVVRG